MLRGLQSIEDNNVISNNRLYSLFEMWHGLFERCQRGLCIYFKFDCGDGFVASESAGGHEILMPFLDLSKVWWVHSEFGSISKVGVLRFFLNCYLRATMAKLLVSSNQQTSLARSSGVNTRLAV